MDKITYIEAELTIKEFLKKTIGYRPAFARIGGGAAAGIMLSQAWYWSAWAYQNRRGWFYKTVKEWEEEAGLTEKEQRKARRQLVERGLIEEKLGGCPAKMFYRVQLDRLVKLITGEESFEPTISDGKKKRMANLVRRKGVHSSPNFGLTSGDENQATITENTTKTTNIDYKHFVATSPSATNATKIESKYAANGKLLIEAITERGGKYPRTRKQVDALTKLVEWVDEDFCTLDDIAGCMDRVVERNDPSDYRYKPLDFVGILSYLPKFIQART